MINMTDHRCIINSLLFTIKYLIFEMIRNCELYNSSQTKHIVTTKKHQSISSMSFGNLKELTEVQQENQVVNVNQKKGTADNFKAKMLQVKAKSS